MTHIAVAVIHGMGTQRKKDVADPAALSFSRGLHESLTGHLGRARMDRIVWREIFWADILQERQDALVGRMNKVQTMGIARRFLLERLGDASNYQFSTKETSTYQRVQQRIRAALTSLEVATGPDAPLVILAHSLGGHMVSTYLWDRNSPRETAQDVTAFERGANLARLVTFGCNIPVFAFGHGDIKAMDPDRWTRPGYLAPDWWHNFYAAADPLSFPLGPTGGQYETLARPDATGTAQLTDHRIVVGGLGGAWNPASHNGYWTGAQFTRPLSALLRKHLA
jgi:hypothetical protein